MESLTVPSWIIDFKSLEQENKVQELKEEYYTLVYQYVQMMENILYYADYRNPVSAYDDFSNYESFHVVDLLTNLTKEFTKRLSSIDQAEYLRKEKISTLNKDDYVFWAIYDKEGNSLEKGNGQIVNIDNTIEFDPIYEVEVIEKESNGKYKRKKGKKVYKHAGQIRKMKEDVELNKEKTFFITKDKDNNMIWYGLVTNNYQDTDLDVIKESAHIKFINKVVTKEVDYPELWIWHLPKAVGDTRWIQYKDGFVMAAGTIFKEYESMITSIMENEPDVRMSHGMPKDTVKYDKDGYIEEYISKEYTLLPGEYASNKLTTYGVTENE